MLIAPRLVTGRAPRRAGAVVLAVLAAAAVLTAGCGATPAASALQARLLSAADLPAGWSAVPVNPQAVRTSAPCLSSLGTRPGKLTYQAASFVEGTAIPAATEVLATGPRAQRTWRDLGRIPDTVSIASAPVRTAHTALGTVGYRAIGTGPPLVLITGYGGTMEGWDRRFVGALARHYHVVIFDNAGIGRTQALPAPLSIDAMASQASALISALGLTRPSVLGWSMGSMIAQALAVLRPDQVRRLILCASYPGNGTALQPSRAAINALNSGNSRQVMAALFPPGQSAAANTYLTAISAYPAAPRPPRAS